MYSDDRFSETRQLLYSTYAVCTKICCVLIIEYSNEFNVSLHHRPIDPCYNLVSFPNCFSLHVWE